jgi:hypothetical protein
VAERYLTIPEVAERLVTTERFPRPSHRGTAHRVHPAWRHVRIAESVLAAYVERCTVAPVSPPS